MFCLNQSEICCDREIKRQVFEGFWKNILIAKFSVIIGGKSPQICFQFFNLNRPQWFTDFGELHCPWTMLNWTWQFSESCSRWKHGRLCSLAQTLKSLDEKTKLVDQENCWKLLPSLQSLIDFSLAWPVTWIINWLSTVAARSFFTTVFLAVWLVNFFLLASRGVFLITPIIILSMLFTPSCCFLYQTFVLVFPIMVS